MGEIDEIRRKYESGMMEEIREDLERFILAHRGNIRRLQERNIARHLPPLSDEVAVKLYILRHRSINPAREIREQLGEINREKWIRGERLGRAPDPHLVAAQWAQDHAAGWRSHRVLAIVYVFDREKDRFLKLL